MFVIAAPQLLPSSSFPFRDEEATSLPSCPSQSNSLFFVTPFVLSLLRASTFSSPAQSFLPAMAAPSSAVVGGAAAAGVNRADPKNRSFTDFEEGYARKATCYDMTTQQYKQFLRDGQFYLVSFETDTEPAQRAVAKELVATADSCCFFLCPLCQAVASFLDQCYKCEAKLDTMDSQAVCCVNRCQRQWHKRSIIRTQASSTAAVALLFCATRSSFCFLLFVCCFREVACHSQRHLC